jgi:ABC-2 type transport system permease protein
VIRVFAYTRVILRQLTRDRAAMFFLIVLPIGIITIIGSVWGGVDRIRVAVATPEDDPLAVSVVDDLEASDGIEVFRYDDLVDVQGAMRRGVVSQGVVIEPGFGAAVENTSAGVVLYVVDQSSSEWFTVRTTVDAIVQETAVRVSAAIIARDLVGGTFDEQLTRVEAAAAGLAPAVEVTDIGDGRVQDLSDFALIAPQQLVLFVLGVMLAWFCIALLESMLIIGVGLVVFGVTWGDPLAAVTLVFAYSAVGSGAGMLLGTLGRNEDRVAAIGPATGMVLGALGGCMMPLEFFPPVMLAVAHLTPHYWGVTAWQELVFDGVGLAGIAPQLGVLVAFAVVLMGTAATMLRRELSGG